MGIVYERVQKVLTWLLRKMPPRYRHFTLHKISDIKNRVKEAKTKLTKTYGKKTRIMPFSSDVTAMYTHLCPKEIKKSIIWMLDVMRKEKQYRTTGRKRTPRKINKNVVTLNVETGEIEWGKGNHD